MLQTNALYMSRTVSAVPSNLSYQNQGMQSALTACANKSSFFRVHRQIYLALYDERLAERIAHHSLKSRCIIVTASALFKDEPEISMHEKSFMPSPLRDIFKFNNTSNQIAIQNPDRRLIFSAGYNVKKQKQVIFLLGCHLMLSRGINAEETFQIFKNIDNLFQNMGESQLNIYGCWQAICRVICMGWIDFEERFGVQDRGEMTIDMEEFMHYSRSVYSSKHSSNSFAAFGVLPMLNLYQRYTAQ